MLGRYCCCHWLEYPEGEENPVKCWGGHKPPLCHHLRSFGKVGGKLGGDKLAGRASDSHNIQNGVSFLKSRNGESAFSRLLPHTRQKAISRWPRSLSCIYAPVWCLWVPVAVKNEGKKREQRPTLKRTLSEHVQRKGNGTEFHKAEFAECGSLTLAGR